MPQIKNPNINRYPKLYPVFEKRWVQFDSLPRAEREGFEPPIHASVYCISSAAHSARLCHLSIISGIFRWKLSCPLRNHNAQNLKNTWKQYLNYTRKMNMKSWWKVLFPIIASGNSSSGKKNPLNYFTRSLKDHNNQIYY